MISRQTGAVLSAVAWLAFAAPAAHAQTEAERAELDAAAALAGSPSPTELLPLGGGGLQCPPGTTATDFYFSDFEADDGGWVGSGAGEWEWGAPVLGVFEGCDNVPEDEPTGAFSGQNVWATNLSGCYANSGAQSLLSQTFDFGVVPAPIQLSWWHWHEIFTPFDIGEVLVNGGSAFNVVPSTPTPDYIQQTADLSAFAGNGSVTIDFRLFATTVVNRAGWYLDDVRIEYCSAGSPVDADLEIEKVADVDEAAPGQTVIYSLTVTNHGPGDATGVTVDDTLPDGVTYVSDDCGAAFVAPTLTWNVGNLANGASTSCQVTVTIDADAAGALTNDATVVADNSDPDAANNDASATVLVGGGASVLEIPVLGSAGRVALVLLLALAASRVLLRRRREG